MVGPLPILKLGFLLVKQVSKPVAKQIAARAKESKLFRDWVCVPIAQTYHKAEVRMKMRSLNLGKATKVPKLSETKAVEQGSELLSEIIILGIASFILILEYNKSSEKDQAKEAKLKADRELIKSKIYELEVKVEKQSGQIRQLTKTAIHLEEEVQKMGLQGMKKMIIGGELKLPKELVDTLAEIPEKPREVEPLKLGENTEIDAKNAVVKEVEKNIQTVDKQVDASSKDGSL